MNNINHLLRNLLLYAKWLQQGDKLGKYAEFCVRFRNKFHIVTFFFRLNFVFEYNIWLLRFFVQQLHFYLTGMLK